MLRADAASPVIPRPTDIGREEVARAASSMPGKRGVTGDTVSSYSMNCQNNPMKRALVLLLLVLPIHAAEFDQKAAERFANLALACVNKEYPNKISHNLN